jgi:hypothetical protein
MYGKKDIVGIANQSRGGIYKDCPYNTLTGEV